jgi:hypothetical protein
VKDPITPLISQDFGKIGNKSDETLAARSPSKQTSKIALLVETCHVLKVSFVQI